MRRPMVNLAVVFVAGILAGDRVAAPVEALFAVAIALLPATFAWPRARPALLWSALFLTGWMAQRGAVEILSPTDLRLVTTEAPEIVSIQGRLVSAPVLRRVEHKGTSRIRTTTELAVDALKRGGPWQPATGRVRVSTPGQLDRGLHAGSLAVVEGVLEEPPGPIAEGLFDYRAHLARRGIHRQLEATSAQAWMRTGPPPPRPMADRFREWAMSTLASGLPAHDTALELQWAMALGWTTGLTDEVAAPFMQSGTMHVFAVSGLHIALIAGILVALLRVGQVPRRVCGLLILPALWFYTAATGWQPSAIRSTLMMSVVIGGWSLERPGDLVNSLAASAFVILACDPQQLFQASFQLSFFVVLSIALWLPSLENWRDRMLAPDPFLPPDQLPRWQRRGRALLRPVTSSFATSFAAWIGSVPLIAAYFHLLTPVSLLANLLIVPLSGLALTSALGSLVCGSWLPSAGSLFNSAGWFWMELMLRLGTFFGTLPGGCVRVPAPPALLVAVYYASLVGLLVRGRTGFFARRTLAVAWVALALAGGLHVFNHRGDTDLVVLAARGGDALVCDGPGRAGDWVIDGGDAAVATFVTAPFLQARGCNRLPRQVLSHGDARHIGGCEVLEQSFHPRELLTGPLRCRSPAYRAAVAKAAADRRLRVLHPGEHLGPWTVLHPAAGDRFARADDGALVLRGEFDGVRVLLCSDLGRLGQRALLERHPAAGLVADIVVAGMPEDGEPLRADLLASVAPQAIILSSGDHPVDRRGGRALHERLQRTGAALFSTDRDGTVSLRLDRGRWELRAMNGQRLAGGPAR